MLTDMKVRSAKPKEKDYRLTDGHGLHLFVKMNGSKLWRWRYEFAGKEKLMSFGQYPDVTLTAARTAQEDARKLLESGIDPMEAKKKLAEEERKTAEEEEANLKAESLRPFHQLAWDWFEWWKVGKDERYVGFVKKRMEDDILPALGNPEITEITPAQVADTVLAIEARGAEDVARRALQTIDQIYRWGITRGRVLHNPAGAFRPKDILKKTQHENFKRIDLRELPTLLREIHCYDGSPVTRLALKLMSLVFLRTSEMIEGEWSEVNWKDTRWDIPKERMKGCKRPHIVPLSRQAITVLRDLQNYKQGDGKWMFPGERGNAFMSNNTILKALERMGYKGKMTGHGFRGVASTFLHENGYVSEHIELQLAHGPDNDVKAAYNYAKYLVPRRKMMQEWADHLDKMLAAELKIPTQPEQESAELVPV
jgi:integrase